MRDTGVQLSITKALISPHHCLIGPIHDSLNSPRMRIPYGYHNNTVAEVPITNLFIR